MERAGADLQVVRLHQRAAAVGPELLQAEDEVLEEHVKWRRATAKAAILPASTGTNGPAALARRGHEPRARRRKPGAGRAIVPRSYDAASPHPRHRRLRPHSRPRARRGPPRGHRARSPRPPGRGDLLPLHEVPRMGRVRDVVRQGRLARVAGRPPPRRAAGVPVARVPALVDLRPRGRAGAVTGRPRRQADRRPGVGADRRDLHPRLSRARARRATRRHRVGAGRRNEAGRVEKVALKLPAGVRLRPGRTRRSTTCCSPASSTPCCRRGRREAFAEGGIARLYPDYRGPRRRTSARPGRFPIMHVVALRRDVFERDPWVAMNLLKAFEEAKRRSLARLADVTASHAPLPWIGDYVARTRRSSATIRGRTASSRTGGRSRRSSRSRSSRASAIAGSRSRSCSPSSSRFPTRSERSADEAIDAFPLRRSRGARRGPRGVGPVVPFQTDPHRRALHRRRRGRPAGAVPLRAVPVVDGAAVRGREPHRRRRDDRLRPRREGGAGRPHPGDGAEQPRDHPGPPVAVPEGALRHAEGPRPGGARRKLADHGRGASCFSGAVLSGADRLRAREQRQGQLHDLRAGLAPAPRRRDARRARRASSGSTCRTKAVGTRSPP